MRILSLENRAIPKCNYKFRMLYLRAKNVDFNDFVIDADFNVQIAIKRLVELM